MDWHLICDALFKVRQKEADSNAIKIFDLSLKMAIL